jgi:uncharacterized membrane protein (UPF0182 family)
LLKIKNVKINFAASEKHIYFVFQSTFTMSNNQEQVQQLQHIKQMMEQSSRFISLSGLSGIAAGCCALAGAWFASGIIHNSRGNQLKELDMHLYEGNINLADYMGNKLFVVAICTFIAAFVLSTLFTWLRSKKTQTPIWGSASKRLVINVSIPMIAGGFYILKLISHGSFGLIAPGCLIFYGLALVNGSKYTLGEVRFLGYGQIILGIINLWYPGEGLYFWAAGFGLLHIVYGAIMWSKYER